MLRFAKIALLGFAALGAAQAQGVVFFNSSSQPCTLTMESGMLNFRSNDPDLNMTSVLLAPGAAPVKTVHQDKATVIIPAKGGHLFLKSTDPLRNNRVTFTLTNLGGKELGWKEDVSFNYAFRVDTGNHEWLEGFHMHGKASGSALIPMEKQILERLNAGIIELRDGEAGGTDVKEPVK